MRSNHSRRYGTARAALLASVCTLALFAVPVHAQQATGNDNANTGANIGTNTDANGKSLQLEPVVIEATRLEPGDPTPPAYAGGQVATGARVGVLGNKDNLDIPYSITSYTSDLIKNQQASDIADVVENDPAVSNSYSYGGSANRYNIRGFTLDNDDVLLDGLYGTAPRQIADANLYERVEVLKGASAFLYGMSPGGSTIGGTINLVPKRATDDPVTNLTATYEMLDQTGGHADIGRRFGKDGQFGIRTNLSYSNGETAIDDEDRQTILGAVSLDYRGENTRIFLDTAHNENNTDHGRTSVNIGGAVTDIPGAPSARTNYNGDWTYADLSDDFVQGRIEHDFNDQIMGYAAAGVHLIDEVGEYSTPTITSNAGDTSYGTSTIKREDTNYSTIAGLRAQFETGALDHEFNIGASGLWQQSDQAYRFSDSADNGTGSIYGPAPTVKPVDGAWFGNQTDPARVRTNDLSSYFLADTLSVLDDRLHVTAGVRRQSVTTRNYALGSGARTKSYHASEYTPAFSVLGNVTKQLSVYGSYIESLSPGETAPSLASAPTIRNPSEQLAPYTSKQYEIGTKLDFGTFGGSISLFQIEKPFAYQNDDDLFATDGEQRNRGLEVSLFGEPVQGVRVLGGVTLLDAKLHDTQNGTNDGNTPTGVPDYIAKLNVEYDLPFLAGATVNARVIHTAAQYVNETNTLEIPSWTRLDVGARYAMDVNNYPVTLRANIENLTNNDYWSSANGGYLTAGTPLTAKISLTADF